MDEVILVAVLVATIAIEICNAAALIWLVRWTRNAGRSIIGSIRKSLNLRSGSEPSLTEEIRDLVGDVSEKLRGGPANALGPPQGALNVKAIAAELGVRPAALRDMAQAYLGGAQEGGADAEAIAADPIGRIMTTVITGGKVTQADWLQAAPQIMAFVRGLLNEPQQGTTAGPGTGYW